MTISSNPGYNDYVCNGVTVAFSFTFKVFADYELEVFVRDPDTGVKTPLVLNSGYTVTGAGNSGGGTVTTTATYAAPITLHIRDNQTIEQQTDLRNQSRYNPETVEQELDRLAIVQREQKQILDRCIKIADGDTAGDSVELEYSDASKASKNVIIDASGNVGLGAPVDDTIAVSAAMEPVVGAATLAAARTSMGPWDGEVGHADVTKYGAIGDGVADDTDAIQDVVNAHLNVYFPPGTYKISGDGIQLRSGNRIFGAGASSILIKSADTNAYVLYAATKTDIVIENLLVNGNRSYANDYLNSKFCIYLAACSRCTVRGVVAQGALADNIVIEYGNHNLVQGCISHNCNKDGIYLSGSEDCSVVGNSCYSNGSNSTGGGIAVAASWNCTITGNECSGNTQFDILLSRASRYCTVANNACSGHSSGQSPLSIYCLAEPMGGVLHGVNYGDGSIYFGASDCTITGNSVNAEMRLELLTDSVVSGNNIAQSSDIGLWLYGCTRVSAVNNRITEYNNYGITLSASAKNGTVNTTSCMVEGNAIYKSGGAAANAIAKSGTGNVYALNTLNDAPLETGGTWTPTLSSNGVAPDITYTDQQGAYAVVGDLVFVRLRVTVNAVNSAGNGSLTISGFPFQSLIKEQAMLTVGRLQNMQNSITATALAMSVESSTSIIYYNPTPTGSASAIQAADALKSAFSITASGVYRIGAA